MKATTTGRTGRGKIAAALAVIVALTAGFFAFAPSAFAHHPEISGDSVCEENGTFTVNWTVGNSETSSNRYMLVKAYSVTPSVGTTTGLTADGSYNGIVGPAYSGPGTVIPPSGEVTATTSGIPGDTTSVTLSVTGFWKYQSNNNNTTTVTETRSFTVKLGGQCTPPKGSLSISKVVTGNSAPPGATYTINYDNGAGTSGSVTVQGGETETVDDLPYGSYTLSEVNAPPGATISPNPAVVGANSPEVKVTVTNPYPNVGSFSVKKQVTGETGGYVPGSTFVVGYSCSNGASGSLTLTNGETKSVGNLPVGTTCTLGESSKPATSGPSYVYGPESWDPSNNITIGNTSNVSVVLTNPIIRIFGGFSVTKQVTGATGGYVPGSEFAVSYDCDNGAEGTLLLENGDTKGVGDLPIGTVCTLEETAKPSTSGPSYVYGPEVFSPSNIVTIVENDDDNVVQVTLTNPIDQLVGSFSVTKDVTGATEGYVSDSTFTVSYDCDNSAEGVLTLADGETETVNNLPVGTTCTLSETTKPSTTGPSYVYGPEVFTPSDTVTIGSTSNVSVTLTNPIERIFGGFSVTKEVTGATEGYVADSTFTVSYDCDNGSDGVLTLADGETETVNNLPVGTTCTLSETEKPATSGPSYVYGPEVFSPSNVVTIVENDDDNIVGVTLSNPIDQLLGSFSVTKEVTGATEGYVADSTFTVSYDCDNGSDGVLTLADGETETVNNLPVGTTCTLSETTKPSTTGPSYVYGPEVFTPSDTVTIGSTSNVSVTLTNPIDRVLGGISVTKNVTGAIEGYVAGSTFGFTLDCLGDEFDEAFTLEAGDTVTFTGIPLGTTCTIAEVSVPDPVDGYEYGTAVLDPEDGTVTVDSETEPVVVTVENPLEAPPDTIPPASVTTFEVLGTQETPLPQTGSNVFGMVALAAGLILAGASLIGMTRRRS